jgi:molecular chaperone GrpE
VSDVSDEHTDGVSPAAEPAADDLASAAADAVVAEATDDAALTVEDLLETLEQVTAQRDEYLDSLQRLQAEFENFRRRSATESEQRIANGLARLAESLLPVLDGCDAAVQQGLAEVAPIQASLSVSLEKEGLERIPAVDVPFNPNEHEAVMHEAGDGGEQVVVEELRSGYRWKGRVLRAAMVKVRN